jgi:hypothetical protein
LRLASFIALAALGLAIASCGGSGASDQPGTSAATQATGATGTSGASQPGKESSGSPARRRGAVVERTADSISFRETSFFGTRSLVTYFVVRPGAGTPLDQAQRCVATGITRAPSAYCFAFASREALRYSKLSSRPPSRMTRPCWAAYWGKPKGRRPIGSDTNGAAASLHCPGASTAAG